MEGQLAAGRRPLTARYALDEVLARGGVGEVWRGRDLRLGRPVAVKVLHGAQADPQFRSRFRAEAQHAARLSHPNIAAVYDYGEEAAGDGDEPTPFLVMELVEGESLADLLARRGRLGVGRTLSILRQLSSALAAAHEAGVVHRDVKPANVLVRPDGIAKITDFGIAASAASAALTETGQVLGTARYLSPEQARGRRGTPASDVYALGLVGYECLAGRPAFDGPDPVQVAARQVAEPPPPLPPDVPQQVRGLVGTATAKDPARRIPDGAAFRDAVDRLLDSERRAARSTVRPRGATAVEPAHDPAPVDTLPPLQPVAVPRPASRRHPWWVFAGVGVLLCGVAAVLVLLGVVGVAGSPAQVRARVGAAPVGTRATSGPPSTDDGPPAGPAVAPDPAAAPSPAAAAAAVPTGPRPGHAGGVRGTARGRGAGTLATRSTASGGAAAGTPVPAPTTASATSGAGTHPGAATFTGRGTGAGGPSGTGSANTGSTRTGPASGATEGSPSGASRSTSPGTNTSGSGTSGSDTSGSSASGTGTSGASTPGASTSGTSTSGTSTGGTGTRGTGATATTAGG